MSADALKKYIAVFTALAVLLSGCGTAAPNKEEGVIVAGDDGDAAVYGLTPVTRDDVVLTARVTATYIRSEEQSVAFDSGGLRVVRVHVDKGARVKKGDLLIELDNSGLASPVTGSRYPWKRIRLS